MSEKNTYFTEIGKAPARVGLGATVKNQSPFQEAYCSWLLKVSVGVASSYCLESAYL
jgi:hypothetical protein